MKWYLRILVIGLLSLYIPDIDGQCVTHGCNPSITGVNYNVNCINQNSNALITVGWSMGGGDQTCVTPAGSWQIQIALAQSGIYSSGISNIIDASDFNWVYSSVNNTFTGTNNKSINWFTEGTIRINVTGLSQNTCTQIASQVNIGIVSNFLGGCSQAFSNQIGDDSGSATLGVSVQQPLPVTLTRFNAMSPECGSIILDWETAHESNNHFFELQRSENGLEYYRIEEIKGTNAGGSAGYTYADKSVLKSVSNYYYRIKQVDFDGKTEYFNPVRVTNKCLSSEQNMYLYPNPALEKIWIDMKGFSQEYTELTISNALGEVVNRLVNVPTERLYEVMVDSLSPGIYTITAKGNNTHLNRRFIKIDNKY